MGQVFRATDTKPSARRFRAGCLRAVPGSSEQQADRVCASRRDATRFLLGSGVDVVCHPLGRQQRRLEAPFVLPVLVDDRFQTGDLRRRLRRRAT